jgi:hypothetical protein
MLEFWVFYLLLGAAVAVAVALEPGGSRRAERVFRAATAVLFWPLYLPLLLAARRGGSASDGERRRDAPADGMARAIAQVERELAAALAGLDGWAEGVLARERGRLGELQRAWRAQAERIRDIDRLLDAEAAGTGGDGTIFAPARLLDARAEGTGGGGDDDALAAAGGEGDTPTGPPPGRHELARRENIARLGGIRRQAHADLMGTLAWVRELASMIHLARFTGAPPARAEELVAQIAAAVEGLSEVTEWERSGGRAPESHQRPHGSPA